MDQAFKLSIDGDSRERLWASELLADADGYERLWSAHIAPLTFRVKDRKNHYFPPSVPPTLRLLADTTYATFYHLTECHGWAHRMQTILKTLKGNPEDTGKAWNGSAPKEQVVPSEILYCFFSHGYSMIESSTAFGEAVNRVLKEYGKPGDPLFTFRDPPRGEGSKRLLKWRDERSESEYRLLSKELSRYRNTLVHKRPVFVLTRRIPLSDFVEEWSGLSAICQAVRDPQRYAVESMMAGDALNSLLGQMRTAMNGVWSAAASALEPLRLADKYLRAQSQGVEKDKDLTLERIRNYIELTRMGTAKP